MRILVCGGRDYTDRATLESCLSALHAAYKIETIIQGGAWGADKLARDFAAASQIQIETYAADWDDLSHPHARIRTRADGTQYDANAGPRRNQRMINRGKPELVVAFPGQSGTNDMINRARKARIPTVIVSADGVQVRDNGGIQPQLRGL